MKIEQSSKPVGVRSVGAVRSGATSAASVGSVNAGKDQVALSSLSARMQQVESVMNGTPEVNSQRVAEIKDAIGRGEFKVDAGKIADELIKNVRQMLGAQSRS
jgi:negative regulator of flagellin synthesis FlgM